MKKTNKAFTLVELLIVISIIGVLVALLTPVISSAQKKTLGATSKVFFSQMTGAIEAYQKEYGFFPQFLTARDRTNLADENYSENLIKALTGKDADGKRLSQTDRKDFNRKAREFIEIPSGNLVKKGAKWLLVDSFGNPNIYICVDGDGDGFIKSGYPNVADGFSPDEIRELIPNQTTGLRSRVIMFTLKKDANKADADYSADNVFTW